ncbi:MAG: PKD domain-containing protein, partial [Flavobacteriales bacterium]
TAAGYWLHHKTQAVDSVASTEMTNPSMQTPEQDSNGTWKSANLDSPNQTILPIDVNPSAPVELAPLTPGAATSSNSTSQTEETNVQANPQGATEENKSSQPSALTFGASVRSACAGVDIDFQAVNGPKSGSYLWNFGDGHFSDEINPKHKFAKSGTYDVSLSVTSDNGQINTTMVNDMITIEDAPNADFTWEFINQDPMLPQVKIIDLSERAQTYHWKSGAQECSTPNCTFLLNGPQSITLVVANAHGCKNERTKAISIHSGESLGAPQNLKIGKDVFMPKKLKQQGLRFSLAICNSMHEVIFTSTSKNKSWDGKNAPEGTYTWKAVVEGLSDEPEYYFGTITLAP